MQQPRLADQTCIPCKSGTPALPAAAIDRLRAEVPGWEVIEEQGIPRLRREFRFKRYADAVEFTNQVAALAETADHHPAILLEWRRVTVTWWTHTARGLHNNDFIMAARVSQLVPPAGPEISQP